MKNKKLIENTVENISRHYMSIVANRRTITFSNFKNIIQLVPISNESIEELNKTAEPYKNLIDRVSELLLT